MPQKKAVKKAKKAAVKKKAATRKTATKKAAVKEAPKSVKQSIPKIDLRSFINEMNKRAYEIFQQRGGSHGNDWEDWFRAERELKKKYGISQ